MMKINVGKILGTSSELAGTSLRRIIFNSTEKYLESAFTNASIGVIGQIAGDITDNVIMGDLSNYSTAVKRYMQQGKSEKEAKQLAANDSINNVLKSGGSGFIQGLLLTGGARLLRTQGHGSFVLTIM